MAVLRESQPTNPVNRASTPGILQSSGGAVKQPNVRKFAKETSTADILLDSVVKVGSKLAGQAWEAQKEDAYIDGVRQAAEQDSEEDLQSSPFMSDWTKGGYRDTKGRAAQAEYNAKLPNLVQQSLTKQNPQEAFQQAVSQAQRELTQTYTGMTAKARAAAFAQNATDIATGQALFTKEYAKWGIAQQEKAIQSTFTSRRVLLDQSKDDPKAYASASQTFAAGVYTDIWLNDRLPYANKAELTKQAMQYAASSDNVQVYTLLKEQQFDFPDGKSGTIMQQLSFEDQIELDTAHRKAMERTKVIRAADFEDTIARERAEWADKDGPGPTITYEQITAQLDEAQAAGILGVGKRETILKEFFTAQARNAPNDLLAQQYASGDFPAIVQAGKSEEDALKAYMKASEGQPYQNTVQGLLAIGNNSGMGSAFKKAGELMAPTIGQLGYSETIDPASAQMAHAFVQGMEEAEKTNPGAYSRTMAGLSSENQDMLLMLREAQTITGIADPATAVQWARQRVQEGKNPAAQQARTSHEKYAAKAIQELEPTSWYELIDKNFGNESALRPAKGFWFENEDRTAAITGTSKIVLAEEYEAVIRTSPFLSESSITAKAQAMAANRAVPTSSGPVFLPRGQTVHQYFGAPQIADKDYIGAAVDQVVPLEDGQRIEWSRSQLPGTPMLFRVMNEDGSTAGSGQIDPKVVGVKVQENLDRDALVASNQVGPGKVVSKGGASVQFNGQNTAGFDAGAMLLLREDIVASEGVSQTSYGDGKVVKGNKAFGVGISQTGKRYQEPLGRDGLYTQRQINTSFMEASNDAAETASRTMRAAGVQGSDWLRFFGELSYQSPGSARDKELLARIRINDKAGAEAALKATNAYKNSPPDRQEVYIKKLKKAMK